MKLHWLWKGKPKTSLANLVTHQASCSVVTCFGLFLFSGRMDGGMYETTDKMCETNDLLSAAAWWGQTY